MTRRATRATRRITTATARPTAARGSGRNSTTPTGPAATSTTATAAPTKRAARHHLALRVLLRLHRRQLLLRDGRRQRQLRLLQGRADHHRPRLWRLLLHRRERGDDLARARYRADHLLLRQTGGKSHTPYYYAYGETDGSSGLGTEFDYTYGASGYQYFGYGGTYEAKQQAAAPRSTTSTSSTPTAATITGRSPTTAPTATTAARRSPPATPTAATTTSTPTRGRPRARSAACRPPTITTRRAARTTHLTYGYGETDGSSGLGSEFDYTYGANSYQYSATAAPTKRSSTAAPRSTTSTSSTPTAATITGRSPTTAATATTAARRSPPATPMAATITSTPTRATSRALGSVQTTDYYDTTSGKSLHAVL